VKRITPEGTDRESGNTKAEQKSEVMDGRKEKKREER